MKIFLLTIFIFQCVILCSSNAIIEDIKHETKNFTDELTFTISNEAFGNPIKRLNILSLLNATVFGITEKLQENEDGENGTPSGSNIDITKNGKNGSNDVSSKEVKNEEDQDDEEASSGAESDKQTNVTHENSNEEEGEDGEPGESDKESPKKEKADEKAKKNKIKEDESESSNSDKAENGRDGDNSNK